MYMPMNKKSTSTTIPSNNSHAGSKTPKVSEKTLAMLRAFAYNYYADPKLPQGIQGILLG